MKISLKDLEDLTRRLYLNLEYPEVQTETILEVLSYAHRRGNFQSLIQEVASGTPRFNAKREIAVEKETSLSCLIDAGDNIGICALHLAADLVVSKARTSGFAIVGVHNSSPPANDLLVRILAGARFLGYYDFHQFIQPFAERLALGVAMADTSQRSPCPGPWAGRKSESQSQGVPRTECLTIHRNPSDNGLNFREVNFCAPRWNR
jgi:hypothetical protein